LTLVLAESRLSAQSTADVSVAAEGLRYPGGVAVHPETQQVYIAESGKGRVIRLVDGQIEEVIRGFPVSPVSEVPAFEAGPLGIAFLDSRTLVCGSGGAVAGEDCVAVFRKLTQSPIDFADADTAHRLPADSGNPAEGDFFGVAVDRNRVWVAGRNDADHGWVSRLLLDVSPPGQFERKIDTRKATGGGLPAALTISPDGFVVVGQDRQGDEGSLLTFYDQTDGKLRAKFELEHSGIVGLAYGPNGGRLFALFHSPQQHEHDGLYKLVARHRNTACEARLVGKMARPMGLAFAANGDLYVVGGGEHGQLLRLQGLDQPTPPDAETPR
jgi:DNA-binding beta-propeller fold protein YncE